MTNLVTSARLLDRRTLRRLYRFGLAAAFALVFAAVAWTTSAIGPHTPPGTLAAAILLATILVAASVVDVETCRLPDGLNVALLAAGLAFSSASGPYAVLSSAVSAAVGFAVLLALAESYRAVRGRDGLGFGDVKLMGAGGSLVGLEGLAPTVLIAALGGLAVVGIAAAVRGRLDFRARLPFGPFLALGLWTVWLHGPEIALSILPERL